MLNIVHNVSSANAAADATEGGFDIPLDDEDLEQVSLVKKLTAIRKKLRAKHGNTPLKVSGEVSLLIFTLITTL